jgi:hypothetical protein
MKRVMVRYEVKPEHVSHNLELVRAVYDELNRTQPSGLRYATFMLPDGVTFVHLASNEAAGDGSPLLEVEAFRRFQAGLRDRCQTQPVAAELTEIGSFKLFGE